MQITPLNIAGVYSVAPTRFQDRRGYFAETYRCDLFADGGISDEFVQDNESMSVLKGTVRGLHFQAPPFAQAKLVRVLAGEIWDVAVDIRVGSPTFGEHAAATLSAENGEQVYIPAGFAHGFCTLSDNTVVAYKVSANYSRDHEFGVIWDDPDLALPWPVEPGDAILSDKDLQLPRLTQLSSPFNYIETR